jgi:hypothetical protein
MAGGWQDLIDTLNDRFANDPQGLAQEFKTKHGTDGNGTGGGKPYKFGNFVHKNDKLKLSERASSRFLMDAGTRHWGGNPGTTGNPGDRDPRGKSNTLENLEAVIKHSLARNQAKKITFTLQTDQNATYASAVVMGKDASGNPVEIKNGDSDPNLATSSEFKVTVYCPPSP